MTPRRLVVLLALAGLFLATYLTLYKLGYIGTLACAAGQSCELVQTSQWGTFLGLPVAAWGVGFYATVLVLASFGTLTAAPAPRAVDWALLVVTAWGVIFSAWLTYLELFVIDAICTWCVVSALLAVTIFGFVLLERPWLPPMDPGEPMDAAEDAAV